MHIKLSIVLFAFVSSIAWADSHRVQELLRALGSLTADGSIPTDAEIQKIFDDREIAALTPSDLNGLVPLVQRCLRSRRIDVKIRRCLFFWDSRSGMT